MEKTMNRRDAFKRIGAAVLGGAAAYSGLLSLASCEARKKKRVILYFTGTGNSLYVARQLADENTELLSIPQLVKDRRYRIEADEVGLVYPIYGHMPPNMVKNYFRKAEVKAGYLFAVLTFGMRKCDAVEIWDRTARESGHRFNYISSLMMVDNWLPNFDMNEQMKMDKHVPENLAVIKADIKARRQWYQPVTQEERDMHQGFLRFSGINPDEGFLMKSEKSFVVTGACIECGVCTYVCPRGNYKLTSGGAKAEGDCEFCFACIQNCPQKAIRFARQDDGTFPNGTEVNPNARYRNEHVSLMDLKIANNQM